MGSPTLDRRAALQALGGLTAAAAAGYLGCESGRPAAGSDAHRLVTAAASDPSQPNILVVIVDEMRFAGAGSGLAAYFTPGSAVAVKNASGPLTVQVLPNLYWLQQQGVTFGAHFTAATQCTAARASLLTGLHGPQHFCVMNVSGNELGPALQAFDQASFAGTWSGFPTWGDMLGQLAAIQKLAKQPQTTTLRSYQTAWFGKWHLSEPPAACPSPQDSCPTPAVQGALVDYGFQTFGCPSPDGQAADGTTYDPLIACAFTQWTPAATPWLACVSFVDPHDICHAPGAYTASPPALTAPWDAYTQAGGAPFTLAAPPEILDEATSPGNWESLQQLLASKPALQSWYASYTSCVSGQVVVPDLGTGDSCPPAVPTWTLPQMLNLYFALEQMVDWQLGVVLGWLAGDRSGRTVAELVAMGQTVKMPADLVVVFTSDHGDYGGSHGMFFKGAGAYDEVLNVPLVIADFTGAFIHPGRAGTATSALTSSVDVAPLLLNLASGRRTDAWNDTLAYLDTKPTKAPTTGAGSSWRLDLLAIASGGAGARTYAVHTDDAFSYDWDTAGTTSPPANPHFAPGGSLECTPANHVLSVRTPGAMYATYTHWESVSPSATASGGPVRLAARDEELYDIAGTYNPADPGELTNLAQGSSDGGLGAIMRGHLENALKHDLGMQSVAARPLAEAYGAAVDAYNQSRVLFYTAKTVTACKGATADECPSTYGDAGASACGTPLPLGFGPPPAG